MYWLPYSSHTSHHPSETPCLPWISYATQKLMLDSNIPYVSVAFFPSLKHNFIAYRSTKVSSRPACNFEIHQQWQSVFSRVNSNCCCSSSFEPKIIKGCQSSRKMYSNNIVNFQVSTTILNAWQKKETLNAPRTTAPADGVFDIKYFFLMLIIANMLDGFKYSYLILIIYIKLYGF